MALAATSLFAAFDVTDGAQERDISPVLQRAIYYDLNLLGHLNVEFNNPVMDTTHYWNEEALNSDIVVNQNASVASTGTALTLTTGHGARVHIGDLLVDQVSGSTEVMQVTSVSSDALTITRTYNSTVAAAITSNASLAIIRAEQEGSDIGTDKTLNPTVRSNYTQIFSTYDLQITGSQLARKMATNEYQDFLARQLAARAIEMKIGLTRAFLYSEKSASAGSDTVYRTMAGLRNWARDNSGEVDSVSSAANYAQLNLTNKAIVDKGVFPDTLIIGTDLVGSIQAIDSTVRRLRESDTTVGYVVQDVVLAQGNAVRVVVDSRVKAGDFFLIDNQRVSYRPLNGRAMQVIAATDFVDGKKRRILGEWTSEVRNPQGIGYGYNKT